MHGKHAFSLHIGNTHRYDIRMSQNRKLTGKQKICTESPILGLKRGRVGVCNLSGISTKSNQLCSSTECVVCVGFYARVYRAVGRSEHPGERHL